jgi:phosphoglycolate phosphatase-like HAD superfamily hydrolase
VKLLALDFDGVISDSAPEAFQVALRTWRALRPDSRIGDDVYDAFLEMMPLGNRAEDYAVELLALDTGRALRDQQEYDAFKAGCQAEWLRAFHKRFYRQRAQLFREDPGAWFALMRPYTPFLDVLRRREGQVELAIATSKDRGSAARLLEAYSVRALFPEGRILDKETGVSKAAHLSHLHEVTGLPYAEMTFVDDKVNHLLDVQPLGVRCVLAAWGYNGVREHDIARAHGFLVCTLDDVERNLFR